MRGKRLSSYLCVFAFMLIAGGIFAQCSPHKIAKKFKPNLKPYKYDSYAYNEVNFSEKEQTIEVVFTAFADMKYKLVFGTSLFDEDVKVNIYDKSMHVHKRNKLYDGSKGGVDNMFWSIEITNPGIYYIDYTIPVKGDSKATDGCLVMLIGYQEK
jgi:hypothetical protein